MEIAKFSSNLIVDDDEDVVRFKFPDENKQIRCHRSLLTKVSPVFNTMFTSENWNKETTIRMNDLVKFNQFFVFKLFVNILYDICSANSVTLEQATDVFFYSHKYQVNIVNDKILSFIKREIKYKTFSLEELQRVHSFSEFYGLDLKEKLDLMSLNLNEGNCCEHFQLADELNLTKMKQRIIEFAAKTIKPNRKWPSEFLCLVVEDLQEERQQEKRKKLEKEQQPKHVERNLSLSYPFKSPFDIGNNLFS